MEYEDEDEDACGKIPECGAIFMSSALTKKECFKRHVFALPSKMAKFVKHVKAGMILFLFEFEKRQLFGVFQAASDGAMDIVPRGFHYSGRHFPAQVRFKPLWYCYPLDESEFQDAIGENYHTPKKFKFGLSEDQVRRLLSLFSSKKVPNHLKNVFVGEDSFELSEKAYMEHDGYNSSAWSDYQMDSLIRDKEDELVADDVVNSEVKVYTAAHDLSTNYHDGFLSKRRRLDCDDGLLMNDEEENEKYHGRVMFRSACIGSSIDPLEVRRLVNSQRYRVYDENQVDKMSNAVISKYPIDPLEARAADYAHFMQMNRLFSDSNLDDSLDQHYAKLLNKNSHAIGDNSFRNDACLQREYYALDRLKTMVPSNHNMKLLAQAMNRSDDQQPLMNEKLDSLYKVCNDDIPVSDSKPFSSLLHRSIRTTDGGMFTNTDRMEAEYDFVTSVTGSSSEYFRRQLDFESRTHYDRNICFGEERVTDNTVDSILCSSTPIKDAGCIATAGRRVVSDGSFRSCDRVQNIEDNHAFVGPAMSKYSLFPKPNQIFLSSSDNPLPETRICTFSVPQNYDSSHSTFDNATIARAAPYIPELPNAAHGCSSYAVADWNSSLGQETHPCHGSLGNFFSQKSSRSMGVELEGGIKSTPTNTSSHQSSLPLRNTDIFLDPNLSMHRALNTTIPVGCGDSVLSQISLSSRAFNGLENIDEEKGLFSYLSKSSEKPFASNGHLQTASQYVPEHVPCNHIDSRHLFCAEDFAEGAHHPARNLSSYGNQYIPGDDNIKEHQTAQSDPSTIRRSVFSRLTPGQDVQVGEDRNDAHFNSEDHYLDASADEVVEMLQQGNNLPVRKLMDSRVAVQPKHVKGDLDKNQIQSHIDLSHPTVEDETLDSYLGIAERTDKVLKETRIVDFKRRSEKKKSLVGGTMTDPVADTNITIPEGEVESPTKKILKRKRLVRPVFVKTEPALEVTSHNISELTRVNDDKQNCDKYIGTCNGEVHSDNVRLGNILDSQSHEPLDDKKNDHSSSQEPKDLELLPSTRDDIEKGHKVSNMEDILPSDLQALHEGTTHDQTCSLENSTSFLSKEADSAAESLKQEEHSSEKLKVDASSGTPRAGEKVSKVKRVKKIVKAIKVVREKGQDCEQVQEKETCETPEGKAKACSLENSERKVGQKCKKSKKVGKIGKVVRGKGQDGDEDKETCETSRGRSEVLSFT